MPNDTEATIAYHKLWDYTHQVEEEARTATFEIEQLRAAADATATSFAQRLQEADHRAGLAQQEVERLRAALERAWAEHERAHGVCSVFSPRLERRALLPERTYEVPDVMPQLRTDLGSDKAS